MASQEPNPTLPEMMATANQEARRAPGEASSPANGAPRGPSPAATEPVTAYDHLWFRGRPIS